MIEESIKDNDGEDYIIKNLKSFYQHMLDYYGSGTSLHEENSHYFIVNDDFRSKIKKSYLENN